MEQYYWQTEEPKSADTKRNILCFYQKAKVLQVRLIDLKHPEERKTVRTVSIDLAELREHPEAIALLHQALSSIESTDERI
ncbi:hypothetical protein SDC9_65050 [bioreactor metagenome]|uniref:Uncharacterized protein n=1 Tax=bioreactor metagenome TaxID=1076179 RepID=A0A644XRU9_9ZZZZ